MMPTENAIVDIVKSVVIQQFGDDAKILSVDISEDIDSDGDPILILKIVYETDSGILNARKASGLLRHIRSRLDEIQESRFPLLFFISKADDEKKRPAAA